MSRKELTGRRVLIKLAARRFAVWNFAALQLEAGTPDKEDQHALGSLPEGGRLWREPIAPLDAVEYVITLWGSGQASGGPYYLVGGDGQRLMSDGLKYHGNVTSLGFERFLNDVHAEGMELLDHMIRTDNEFLHTLSLLSAMAAADRVWSMNQNTTAAQGLRDRSTCEITADVEQAGVWNFIEWDVDRDGYYPLFTDTWEREGERLAVKGGALQRLQRDEWPSMFDDDRRWPEYPYEV